MRLLYCMRAGPSALCMGAGASAAGPPYTGPSVLL